MRTSWVPVRISSASSFILGWCRQVLARFCISELTPASTATSEMKFEASLSAMSDAVFICDNTGVLTNFNDAFVRFHRFESREECKQTVKEYPDLIDVRTVDGRALPLEQWPVPRALRGEAATNIEYLLRRKDSNEAWFGSYSFAPIRLSQGTVIGSVVTARDVTRSKQVEEELRNLSSRLHLALTSAHLGVWDWDIRNQQLFWDDRMLELYGISRQEFSNTVEGWETPLHPDDRARALEELKAALKGECEWDTEFRVVHRDGSVVYLKANGLVIRAADGTPERMLGVNADITARKKAEADLKNAYAEIEAKVAQRTSALEAAKIAAEKSNLAKDHFLAILSHELRSPLAAILSWSQMMERGGLSPDKMQLGIRTIKENVWSQNQLISDLLDISRITTGKLLVDIQTVNVHEVALAAIDTIRLTAEQRGISVVENLDGTDLYINADPARLKQVLWNLLSNAVKFTPRGGTIFVSLSCQGDDPQRSLAIEVRDTGQGIKSEFLPHLFNTFSQADASSIRVHGGMGLGLSLVKSLVNLQGGSVSGDSLGEGKGAAFVVTFPLVADMNRLSALKGINHLGDIHSVTNELLDVRILLVEDGDKTREALQHLLEVHGAKVHATASAQEALTVFDSVRPDVLVSDIAMPQEDGHSLLRKLRSIKGDRGAKVPAIALTAFGEARDRSEAFASGFQEYLTKPVDEAVLTSTIRRLLTLEPRAGVASPPPA